MSINSNDGGPAFPRPGSENRKDGDMPDGNRWVSEQGGMSLRDYFAAKALPQVMREYFDANKPCFGADHFYKNVPAHAYQLADAMLEARKK